MGSFFRENAAGAGALYLSSASRGQPDIDDTLRPSLLSASAIDAKPIVITHIDHGILSGRLGKSFLKEHGLNDDLTTYGFGVPDTSDKRPRIALSAYCVGVRTNGCLFYGVQLEPDGTFEQALPPGTYDLELGFSSDGAAPRRIAVSDGVVVIHENQRTVVQRP